MTSVLKVDQIETVSGIGTITIPTGNTLDASSGFIPPAGSVLQVVEARNTTSVVISASQNPGNNFISTGTSASITPSSTSSKILILAEQSWFFQATYAQGIGFRIYSSAAGTNITDHRGFTAIYNDQSSSNNRMHGYKNLQYLDSPNTTSSVTYTIQGAYWVATGGGGNYVEFQYGGVQSPSSIILMEIAG